MTLVNIAKLAGVSQSTVSRVINNHPRVARGTAEAVRRAIEEARFTPRRRVKPTEQAAATIAFLVFGASGSRPAPTFEHLLRGVSAAATDHNVDTVFAFISDPSQLPPKVLQRGVDGLLLHGEQPSAAVQTRLHALPSVWLMANRQRPAWGDEVTSDNTVVGELAARYLIRRGHRRLAPISLMTGPWAFDVRTMSFTRTAEELGAGVATVRGAAVPAGDFWETHDLPKLADSVVKRLVAMDQRPTGLFVVEDRQVPLIDDALRRHGLRAGHGLDVEIVSCNNERPHLMNLNPVPATIDIRAESIGRRGVEMLLARLQSDKSSLSERIRSMVEPVLVEPPR